MVPTSTVRPAIHDSDTVAAVRDRPQIVTQENERSAVSGAERHEKIEDLPPNGGVERSGRLIGHDQLRVSGDGHGDGDPLGHAAGELVRIAARDAAMIMQPDIGEQRRDVGVAGPCLHHWP